MGKCHRAGLLVFALPIVVVLLFSTCAPPTGPDPAGDGDTDPPPPILPVLVTVGDSITMGIQDAGLKYDYQVNCYPYLIAQQLGLTTAFRQPYLNPSSPGIAMPPYKEPLSLSGGEIQATLWEFSLPYTPEQQTEMEDYLVAQLATSTLFAQGMFHNLGVSGARLLDIRNTTGPEDSEDDDNPYFLLVLQNTDTTSRTVATQVAAMEPDYIIVWIGNNDILHVVLDGAGIDGAHFDDAEGPEDDMFLPTDGAVFAAEYAALLSEMVAITPNVIVSEIPAYLPFVSALDGIYSESNLIGNDPPSGALCAFDPSTFEPIDFNPSGDPLFLPLLVEDTDPTHMLLSGAIAYMDLEDPDGDGEVDAVGLPDAAALELSPYSLDPESDAEIIATILNAYATAGLVPTGNLLPGTTTMTDAEIGQAQDVMESYNLAIADAATLHGAIVVDMADAWWSLDAGFGGYSGDHAIQDQDTTTFSLDGVHPNHLGQALSANAFIAAMNSAFGLSLGLLDPAAFSGQYTGLSIQSMSLDSLKGVKDQW